MDYQFFVIDSNISLPKDTLVVVGRGSVLCFEGGRLSGGRLDINGAIIQAADYCIFDSITIIKENNKRCNFGNDEVSAAWFGQVGEDGDIGPVVNRALKIVPEGCVVTLHGNSHTLKSSIVLDSMFQAFRCPGTLKLAADVPAICTRAGNLLIDVGAIERVGGTATGDSQSAGILFDGRTTYTDVKIGKISGTKYGLAFIPDMKRASLLDSDSIIMCETSYTKIDFGRIETKYGLYYDLYRSYDTLPEPEKAVFHSNWVTEVMVSGGCIDSEYGIYCEDRPTQIVSNNKRIFSGELQANEFVHITFGDNVKKPMRLCGVDHSYFPYTVISKEAQKQDTWVELKKCKHVEIGLLHPLPYEKVKVNDGVYQSEIRAPITGAGIDAGQYIDRMYVYCNDKWNNGSSTKYLSSSMQPNNIANTLNYTDVETSTTNIVTPANMMLTTGEGLSQNPDDSVGPHSSSELTFAPQYLSDLCVLNIGKNRHVVMDLTSNSNVIIAPVTIVASKIETSGSFSYKSDSSGAVHPLGTGVYRVTWDKNYKAQIIKIG